MWIWQQQDWPNFSWDEPSIIPLLREIRLQQGILLGKISATGKDQQAMLDTLLANIIHSSAIEDEKVNAFSVRSSLAKKLNISEDKPFPTSEKSDGLAEIMLDAINNLDTKITIKRIFNWHKLLFPEGASLFSPAVVGGLRGEEPMQVVSGRIDKPIVHFEAPPQQQLKQELERFIFWFNESRSDVKLDPLIRAAITHLWFVTIHPFADGNGRITRLLTDLALAQAEKQSVRFYAMSVSILENRNAYYEILEQTQRGGMDITAWVIWFLETLQQTINGVLMEIEQTIFKTNYWLCIDQTALHAQQVKVLNRMLDGDFAMGINTSQYAKVAKISRPTATRHLTALVRLGCLTKTDAGGRSTRYKLNRKAKQKKQNQAD